MAKKGKLTEKQQRFVDEYLIDLNATQAAITPIIASGIVQQDSSIMDLIGEHGNVATIPIYKPIDANESGMEALNNDGETNNTPVEISGDKQTFQVLITG